NFQLIIYQRFIDTSQCEKLEYPKVFHSIEINSKTDYYMK
ncbi:unnamed protein product, partial [Rotaria sp. Silwood1]